MKNTFKFLAIFGIALTLASCAGSETDKANGDQENTAMNETRHIDLGLDKMIKLNDGKPWKINPETAKGIDKMEQILREYKGREQSREKYNEISARLMEQFEYIVNSNKMEGEAREQLYNYIKPMKIYFEELNSNDLNVAENAVMKFQQHLNAFTTYFNW